MYQCNQYFSLQFLIIISFISASTFAAILFHAMPNPDCHGQSSRRYLVGLTEKDNRNNAKNCRGSFLMSEKIFESQICEAKRNVVETFRNIPISGIISLDGLWVGLVVQPSWMLISIRSRKQK